VEQVPRQAGQRGGQWHAEWDELGRSELVDADRASLLNRLVGHGIAPETAERWVAAWEALDGDKPNRASADFWDSGFAWVAASIAAGHEPPSGQPD
jgi:hypothetical protein